MLDARLLEAAEAAYDRLMRAAEAALRQKQAQQQAQLHQLQVTLLMQSIFSVLKLPQGLPAGFASAQMLMHNEMA